MRTLRGNAVHGPRQLAKASAVACDKQLQTHDTRIAMQQFPLNGDFADHGLVSDLAHSSMSIDLR